MSIKKEKKWYSYESLDAELNRMRDDFTNGWVWFIIAILIILGVSAIRSGTFITNHSDYITIRGTVDDVKTISGKKSKIKIYLSDEAYEKATFQIYYMFWEVNRDLICQSLSAGDTISLIVDKKKFDKEFHVREAYGPRALSSTYFEILGLSSDNQVFFDLSDYQEVKNNSLSHDMYVSLPLAFLLMLIQIFVKDSKLKLRICTAILIGYLLIMMAPLWWK